MPAPRELSLSKLLATLKPVLSPSTFVFATFRPNKPIPPSLPVHMLFYKAEGTIIITTQAAADAEIIDYDSSCRMITLDVHSSLEAADFIAVVAERLKALGMGVNPVSGYYHDHCFVPVGRENEAVACLAEIAREARGGEKA